MRFTSCVISPPPPPLQRNNTPLTLPALPPNTPGHARPAQ
jgi:hypothetical protein